jgi:SAM-dependent methyltransferase
MRKDFCFDNLDDRITKIKELWKNEGLIAEFSNGADGKCFSYECGNAVIRQGNYLYWYENGSGYTDEQKIRENNELFFPCSEVYLKGMLSGMDIKSKVLDVGCGYGRLLKVLNDINPNLYGIDGSAEMIENSVKTIPNLANNILFSDVTKCIPFNNRMFDLVYACTCLLHISESDIQSAIN